LKKHQIFRLNVDLLTNFVAPTLLIESVSGVRHMSLSDTTPTHKVLCHFLKLLPVPTCPCRFGVCQCFITHWRLTITWLFGAIALYTRASPLNNPMIYRIIW